MHNHSFCISKWKQQLGLSKLPWLHQLLWLPWLLWLPCLPWLQALMSTRYPTRPRLFFLPKPTQNFFLNFTVQGSSYICDYQSKIFSFTMLWMERRPLKIMKIFQITLFRNIKVINWHKNKEQSQTVEVRNIHGKGKDSSNFHFQGLIFVSHIEFPF